MFFYKFIVTLLYPLIRLYLGLRRRRGKEDADSTRFRERLGRASIARPNGFLVWIHGASVGELNSLRGIIPRIKRDYPRANILVTSGTVTSKGAAKNLDAIHQYVPVDVPFIIRRFMKHWRPDVAIRVDSDLWPIQLDAIRRARIPNFLINGAVSEKSFKKHLKYPKFAKKMISSFTLIMAKSGKDAARISGMGAQNVMVINNLKYTTPPPADKPDIRAEFMATVGARPVWHAAVLGENESGIIYAAHEFVLKKIPNALLIITPRHPSMKDELSTNAHGLKIGFRSNNSAQGAAALDVYVADTFGEMGVFYRTASVAFMGRSLLPDCRGSSPIEAMQLGNVVATGEFTSTFDEIYDELSSAGILTRINNSAEISEWVISMLSGNAAAKKLQSAQKKITDDRAITIDTIMSQLRDALKKVEN